MEKRNYEITVQGQYYGVHDTTGTPTIKSYVAKFILPTQEAALSVICRHLLDPYLRKHYPDYAKFRSHKITSVVVNGRPPDTRVLQMSFDDMGVADLSDFCILKQIFIDPYKHKDLEKCRIEVRKVWEARVSQMKADEKSGVAKEKLEVDALLEMNGLPADVKPEININEQKILHAAEKGHKVDGITPLPETEPELPPADDVDLLS